MFPTNCSHASTTADLTEQYSMYAELLGEVMRHQDMLAQRLEDRIRDMGHSVLNVVVEMREVARSDGTETRNFLDEAFAKLSPRQENSINSERPSVNGLPSQRPKHSGFSQFPSPPPLATKQEFGQKSEDVPITGLSLLKEPETEVSTPDQNKKAQSATIAGTSSRSAVSKEIPSQIEVQSKPLNPSSVMISEGNVDVGKQQGSASDAEQEVSASDADAEQGSASNAELQARSELKKSKSSVFDGHPELLSFLQAKNWESEFIHFQECQDEDEKDEHIESSWRKKLQSVIESTTTDLTCASVILANACAMGLQLEYEGTLSAEKIGIERDEGNWPDAEQTFLLFENIFTIFFVLELCARLAASGCVYFKSISNWGDFFIVLMAVLELYILPIFATSFPNLSFIRILRVFRLLRCLRIIRLVTFFENLRVLMVALVAAMKSFLWSMILLGMVAVIGAIFMCQSLQSYLQDEQEDPEVRALVYAYYGSWSRALITVFEMTLAIGTWSQCGRIVIFKVSRYYAIFFISYLAWVSFAMIRVISALFLKDTLASAELDNVTVMAEMNRDPEYIKDVQRLYKKMDRDGNGHVSFDEMPPMLDDPHLAPYLKELGISPHELKGMLELFDDGNNVITFVEFLSGVMRLKASSRTVDLATLCLENKKVLSRVIAVGNQVDEVRWQVTALQAQYQMGS